MTNFTKTFTTSLLAFLISFLVYGQAPPLAFTGFNSDNPDMFSFVLLQSYSSGDVINFTDNGWQASGSFRTTEGVFALTFTCDVDCGADVVVNASTSDAKVGTDVVGSIAAVGSAMALATSGDQIFAFTGTLASPTILAGIDFDGGVGWDADATSSNNSALPPALIEGVSANSVGEADNGAYGCGTTAGSATTLAQAINVLGGWTTSGSPLTLGACGNYTVEACGIGEIDCPVPPDPTPLCLGDIAFTGFQSDNPDMFSFIILKDIGVGTEINFTDNGWFAAGGFRATENTMTLTFSEPLSCGDEVKVDGGTGMATSIDNASVGIISGSIPELSSSGDQIFAYQGTAPTAGNESGFLAAIHFNGSTWDAEATNANSSAKPCVFEDGVSSISVPEADNGIHGCSGVYVPLSLTPSMIRSLVNDISTWSTSNSISFMYPPFCGYECGSCTYPVPLYLMASGDNTCPGDPVQLEILAGDLNDATEWVWYTDCCGGGTQIGTGTSIMVNPTESTVYYVRGEGGCVDVAKCKEFHITVMVDNEPPVPACNDITITFNGEDEISFNQEDVWDPINSMDNCGTVNFESLSQTSVTCDEVSSVIPVTVNVTDFSGNPGSCIANVTVDGLPCGFMETDINCPDGTSSTFNMYTSGGFGLTSEGCYEPAYYRPEDSQAFIKYGICGDGEIIAEVSSVMGTGWAGITMREGLGASERMIQLLVDGVSLTSRELRVTPGGLAFKHLFQTAGRNWLRLTRTGNTFGAYHSTDGVSWAPVLITNIPMNPCILIGLTTMNGAPSGSATGIFDNVTINTAAPLIAGGSEFDSYVDLNTDQVNDFSIFPNPAVDKVNVKLESLIGKEVNISIYNNLGQVVKFIKIDEVQNAFEKIDIPNFEPGTYIINIQTDEETIAKKFIVGTNRP